MQRIGTPVHRGAPQSSRRRVEKIARRVAHPRLARLGRIAGPCRGHPALCVDAPHQVDSVQDAFTGVRFYPQQQPRNGALRRCGRLPHDLAGDLAAIGKLPCRAGEVDADLPP